jgi:hypothetical protein
MCCRSLAIVLFEHLRRSQVTGAPGLPYEKLRADRTLQGGCRRFLGPLRSRPLSLAAHRNGDEVQSARTAARRSIRAFLGLPSSAS